MGKMSVTAMLMTAADGTHNGMEKRNWYTATHPFKYTTSISVSPKAFSLYTLDMHMGTHDSTMTAIQNS